MRARALLIQAKELLGTGHYLSPGGGGVGVSRGRSHGFFKTFRGDQP